MKVVTEAYFRFFEPLLLLGAESRQATLKALRAARIGMLPEWYLTLSYMSAGSVGAAALFVLLPLALVLGWLALLLALCASVTLFALTRLSFLLYPRMKAAGRGRSIDQTFPSAAILAYALAKGGLGPLAVFRTIAEERHVFGEVSIECARIVREVEWMGQDLMTAVEEVASTTPSPTFRGFLEGLVTIMNSGADPRDYLRRQAQAQLDQAEMRMQKDLDQTSMLAEVYVSGLLVLPLLLVVILSVLSALGDGKTGAIPAIVFGMLPLGTAAYLLLVEILLPVDPLGVPPRRETPLADFGTESVRTETLLLPPPREPLIVEDLEEAKARTRLRRQVVLARWRQRTSRWWRTFRSRGLAKPIDAIEVSGGAALLVFVLGGTAFWLGGFRGSDLVVAGTGLLFAAATVAAAPVSLFHELRVRRARQVAAAIPEFVSRLSSFNERGIGIVQSFRILGHTSQGTLASDLRAFDRDIRWNASLDGALDRLGRRVDTLGMAKLVTLFRRASQATGNLKEILDIAAGDATRSEALRVRRHQAMMSYIVVIYVVFGVFLYVLYMVTNLFYGDGGLAGAAMAPAGPGGAGATSGGLEPERARVMFFHAALIQAVCCGFVSGRLGEGHLLSGIKHAAILAMTAYVVFTWGVFT